MTDQPTSIDTDERTEVTYTRDFDAPRELIFDAFFDPEQLAQFWGPTGMSTPVDRIVIEPVPGGRFETVMVNDETGEEYPGKGVFVEIEKPGRFSWREEGDIVATTTLTDLGDGRTRMVIHQTNVPVMFSTPEAQAGFQTALDKFAAHLAKIQA